MMNVLTDILCDTSSLMASQNYKTSLPQSKIISSEDISSKQAPLHLLDSVSHISSIERPLSNVNHSSPSSIDLFNASSQIHIPSNMDSGFEDRNQVSVFSDSFPEIVPSWLTHDFMKVSDNLPSPGILSNVSDIYPSSRENEHLEMLDLGFPPELTSQDVPNNLNRSCIDDGQKLLAELPMQRFSTNDSLLIPSFNDINTTQLHLSMNKNGMHYQKFKHNAHHVNASRSLINSVLPCENELLHLPLSSNLTEQCLSTTSSPSMMPNSQSQSHPVDVVCDKLPQINLNHLDSLLGNETALTDIQLLRHDFPSVRLPEEDGCNPHSNRNCLDNCTSNRTLMSCDTGNFLSSNIQSLPHSQDISVQVPESVLNENFVSESENCFSCSRVSIDSAIEVIQCFKCKFCDFISLHKCDIANHIDIVHSKTSDSVPTVTSESTLNSQRSDNVTSFSLGGQSETHLPKSNAVITSSTVSSPSNVTISSPVISSERDMIKNVENHFQCIKCTSLFSDINNYNSHLLSDHMKPEQVHLTAPKNIPLGYQLIPINGIVNPSAEGLQNKDVNMQGNLNSSASQNDGKNSKHSNMKRRISPIKTDEISKKNLKRLSTENCTPNSEKTISSHKKAWQKKMRRELGSYICEFKGCNVRFRALDNLEYHRKCHVSGGSAFACPECGTSFENWGPIAGHLWRDHGNDMELHACDQCPFRTYSLSRLENLHKRIHRDECLFLCDTCGKSFKNGKQLRNHRVIHSKVPKPKTEKFGCDICSGTFSSKRVLHLHQETVHNKIKPFLCNYCDYSASKRSTMRMHMRQHTGEKPFMCDKCEYRTSDHNSLRRHKMTHSGEKPYKCPYCPYSSIQASCYKDHLKKHPGQNEGLMFSCSLCSFRTLKQDSYLVHMREHESLNMPQRENSVTEINATDEIFPLAEAMDISLSHGDHNILSDFNKNKNIQSFLNNLSINIGSMCQESAT